jgi:WD40 repeat-containing protein SMU1
MTSSHSITAPTLGGSTSVPAFSSVDRLMEGEFTVEASDLIRIVLGFLTSQGLQETAKCLRKESGIGFDSSVGMIQKKVISNAIRQGDWGTVFQATVLMQEGNSSDDGILTRIAEQVILELAEEDKCLNLAYSLLKTHREALDQIPEEDGDEDESKKEKHKKKSTVAPIFSKARSLEQRLAAIAGNPTKYADTTARQEVLFTSQSKQDRRDALAQMVEDRREIPLNRLPTLVQQAMKWQSHTGQLPWIKEVYNEDNGQEKKRRKRKRYNLVMGEVAGGDRNLMVGDELLQRDDDDENREAIPQDILAKVKFGKSAVCESAVFSHKGLITGSSDSLIEIWDSNGYKDLNTTDYPYQKDHAMGHNESPVLSMDLSNDGEILASGDAGGKVKIWKLATGKCLRQYQAHDASVTALALSRDASRVLAGSASGICREFGLVTQNVLQVYEGHTSYIHACRYVLGWSFANEKNPLTGDAEGWVVTASADGTVRLWQKGITVRILQPPRDIKTINLKSEKAFSLTVDHTAITSECPGIHTVAPVPGDESRILIVARSPEAFLVSLEGMVLQLYQTDVPETVFLAATVTANVVYLVTSKGDCLIFSLRNGKLVKTVREFALDSTTKTNSEQRTAEISTIIHHPTKPSIIATFSNDKTQKKGILAVWK